jgi:hypothetical protein
MFFDYSSLNSLPLSLFLSWIFLNYVDWINGISLLVLCWMLCTFGVYIIRTINSNFINNSCLCDWSLASSISLKFDCLELTPLFICSGVYVLPWLILLACLKGTEKTCPVIYSMNSYISSSQLLFKITLDSFFITTTSCALVLSPLKPG